MVGLYPTQPQSVKFHGYIFSNSSTAGTVTFYTPNAASGGQNPVVPGSGTGNSVTFVINVPATPSTVAFWDEAEILFENGLYVIASAATITGVVLYS